MAFTRNSQATNNISALPNKPLITATALKQKFDQGYVDEKSYNNDVLLVELEAITGTSGAENIGSKTVSGLAGNTVWAQISALWTAVQNIVIGSLPDNSVTNDKIAIASKIGLLADLTTSVKTNIVAAINSIAGVVGDGSVTWPKLATDMQNRELKQDKAITELLMLADIDSKVFSPNLGKFYTNFSAAMDYSLGTVDATNQQYVGTLSAGATNVVLTSASGFSAGQEISIQDATHYEEVVVSSVVSTTVSFKTALVNSYTNPNVYRSNNNATSFGDAGGGSLTNSVFGSHFDGSTTDYIGGVTASFDSSTSDTTNKKFGTASRAFNGSQYIQYADNSLWEFGSSDFYIDFQIRRTTSGVTQYVMGKSPASGGYAVDSFSLRFNTSNQLIFSLSNTTSNFETTAPVTITDTAFHNVRFGRNGNNIYIAVDGDVSAGTSYTGSPTNNSNAFTIARGGDYPDSLFTGNIDEFLFVKGTGMNTTDFTPPTAAYGGVPVLKNVIRMNITPYEDVKYISAWLTKTDLSGFTADGKLSIVDASADESYVDLTESITDLGATQEVMMIGNAATVDSKVTLKLELNRASTSDSVSFTKLIGGVSA